MQVKKKQLEPDMEPWTGSKLGKEYVKAAYYLPAYLTYMQIASWENAGLDKAQARIKISRRNINNLRYANDTTSMAESSAAQFSHSVMSDSLRPLGLKHARPPWPSQLLEFTQTHVH